MHSDKTPTQTGILASNIIFLLGALSGLAALSTDIYLPALDGMAIELNAQQAQAQLTLAIFFMGYGFGQLLFGPLSDSLGRRSVLLAGLYIYTASSLMCALNTDIDYFVLNRLLQALGGCATAVSTRAIVSDCTRGEQTAKAMAGIMTIIQVAPIIAPPIGGLILLAASWRAIFYALAAYGLVCIIAAHIWIKETHPQDKRQPLRISNIARGYWLTLSNRAIVLLLVAEVAASISLLTFVTGSPRIFSQHYGLNPQHFSLLFALIASGLVLGGYLGSRFIVRFGIFRVVIFALMFSFVSSITLLTVSVAAPENMLLLVVLLWFSLAPCAALRANYIALGLQYMPDRRGTIAALFGALSLGLGGISAIVIGGFAEYTPVNMATMICCGYLTSGLCYGLWYWYEQQRTKA